MTKKQAQDLGSHVADAIRDKMSDMVRIVHQKSGYDPKGNTLKLSIVLTMLGDDTVIYTNIDDRMLESGAATGGMIVWTMWEDGTWYLARIVDRRRGKHYVFEWVGEEELGLTSRPFTAFKLRHPVTGQRSVVTE